MRGLPYIIAIVLSCATIIQCLQEPCKDCDFTSVVDILSASAMFSTFLRVLQRNGDIPTLNEMQNFTLLAPVNTAFIDSADSDSYADFDLNNYILKDKIMRLSEVENGTTIIFEGVKYPLGLRRHESGTVRINEAIVVEPDLTPNFQNATVHAISQLLPNPPDTQGLIHNIDSENRNAAIFKSFVQGFSNFDQITYNNTLLIPLDVNFFKCFNHIEINYILDTFDELSSLDGSVAADWIRDRQIFLQNLICGGIIGGRTIDELSAKNFNDLPVHFNSHELGSSISVNGSTLSDRANLVFDRGVAHTFSQVPFLSHAFQFNAEKYLHGMNSTDFVRELHFRKLQHLVREKSLVENLTIFVPEVSLNERQGFSKSSLLYHFIEDQLWLEDIFKDVNRVHSLTKTFPSAFCSSNKRLGGNCQRLRITKAEGSYIINDKYRILHAKPYVVGRTLIYTISDDLQLPGEFLSSMNPFYHCSRSLSFLRQANLLDFPVNNRGYTILLPCFDSWHDYDLNVEYLRGNVTAVEHIAKSLILQTLIYSDTETQTIEVKNMLDEVVSLSVHSSPGLSNDVEFELSNVAGPIKVERGLDSLFNQGVIHPLKNAYFPKDMHITLSDLLETTGADNFIQLLKNLKNLSSILDGNEPYSILVPTSSSLDAEGITANSTNLQDFLKLHIVNGTSTNNILNCEGQAGTLFGQPLNCRQTSPGSCSLKLQNGIDNEVRILRRGCSSPGNQSCVFLIDRPLSLLWLRREKNPLRLPGIAIGAGLLVGSVSMLAVFLCLLLVLFGKSAKKPVLPRTPDQQHTSGEAGALLANNRPPRTPCSPQGQNQRFESTYSSNASVPAIDVTGNPR